MKKSPSERRGIFCDFFDGNAVQRGSLDGGFNPPNFATITVDQRKTLVLN